MEDGSMRNAIAAVAGIAIVGLVVACSSSAEQKTEWTQPLPDLNKIEECQRTDLSRYYNRTFRFHLYECWADVSIDGNGRVTAFIADNVEACEKVLAQC